MNGPGRGAAHIAIDGRVTTTGKTRRTAVDKRITRHPGYTISQCCRKRIEEIFGWTKTVGGLAQLKMRGLAKAKAAFTFGLAAVQSCPIAQASGGPSVTRTPSAPFRGKWRIVQMDLWDKEYLDMLGPAHITFQAKGHGEFTFGCVQATMTCDFAKQTTFFTWEGFDEMDPVHGDGWGKSPMTGPSKAKSLSTTATNQASKPQRA